MSRNYFLFSILFFIVTSCNSPKMKKVDLIVTNARVYTVNDSFNITESFAIQDGKTPIH